MSDDLHRHFPFSTFRTKQNVSKSKLGGEFAKKGWNDFSTGFSENASAHVQQITFKKGEESIKKKPKIDPDVFKKRILTEGCKSAKRKPIIEHKEADFFTSKAKDLCSLIQKKSLQSENKKNLKTHNFNRCPNSVFLEVQNIQDSFQQTKSTHQPKFCVKSSSEFSLNFITDLVLKKAGGQENVPKKNRASACQFISGENDFSHSVPIKKVQKTNVFSDLYSSSAKRNYTVINNLSDSITNSEVAPLHSKKNRDKIRISDDVKFQISAGKVLLPGQNQKNNASFNLAALLGDESSKNKGSSWLQSLQTSGNEVPQEDTIGRKRIRNIQPGGFAEQMLKLQRIEKSEEVIWDHNVDRSKRKGKSLPLMLTSVSSTADLVIAKCLSLQAESSESSTEGANPCERGSSAERSNEVSVQSTESKSVVVLLRKAVFNKLHLKVQSIFHLYPPWQTLHLPLISRPVILCAKFIDFNSGEGEVMQDKISYSHPRGARGANLSSLLGSTLGTVLGTSLGLASATQPRAHGGAGEFSVLADVRRRSRKKSGCDVTDARIGPCLERDYSLGMLRCIAVSSVLGDARDGAEDDSECGAGGVNFLQRFSASGQAEWDPAGESEKKG
ncbi:hypothetical protein AVEN_161597-1 [Araneus ventricosus]|uniref:DUF4502 domain-containing protein n=1 Tax=Araneus ventricosus TaxID=182803 RepID=A0A4Y2FQR3_ARAVE|nr:hypothetical protein AVEN_161597-1 [Araneus ventricosus]